jgi:threonine aldolase
VIDLRSDTVTRPTRAMREAMAGAEVGDDVYGEDPTVNRLQERAAQLLGFEAALWMPTGTMANEVAIRILTRPGQEVLVDDRSHVVRHELSGMAVLSGVLPRALSTPNGKLTPELVRQAAGPRAYFRAEVGLVVLENTHNLAGGVVSGVAEIRGLLAACRECGFNVHIDGARLWNAAVALGVPPRELAAGADTLMVALSKGLCAPAGSLLLASRPRIEEARRVRKQLGGGMRQVGVLAAAGLVALDTQLPRLAEDHANARLLAAALAGRPGVRVAPVETNIVVAELQGRTAAELAAALAAEGVRASVMDTQTLRLVTHADVSRAECEAAVAALGRVLSPS